MKKKVHFIAIGGSVMHNLALMMHKLGWEVTGSDDVIYDPALTKLQEKGLLPTEFGWTGNRIHANLDLIILGMHAQNDNPELLKAQELGLQIMSFPEFIGEHAKDKVQIVVAGSHGKTTTTSMIMHILKHAGLEFDYLVGAQLEGYDTMVHLSDAPIMVIEGDEYLSSRIDMRSKFHHYNPRYLIITGLAWDHFNVFPSYDLYQATFEQLLLNMSESDVCFYDKTDQTLEQMIGKQLGGSTSIPYDALTFRQGKLHIKDALITLNIFGEHNMKNLHAAYLVCQHLGLSDEVILPSLSSFKGASKRQELMYDQDGLLIYRDYAHAPSKVRATAKAFREKFHNKKLILLVELHTYSSLNKNFLPHYKESLKGADLACVYFNKEAMKIKRMDDLDQQDIKSAFQQDSLQVFEDIDKLKSLIETYKKPDTVIVLMSSGNFGGMKLY